MARQTAYVRYKPDADNLTISLVLGGRQRNLNRPTDEPLEKPITRIRANLVPAKQDKRNKKKKLNPEEAAAGAAQQQQEQELFVGLFKDAAGTELIDAATPNGQAWPQAALLRVGSQVFDVLLNPPTVETLALPGFPMAGYPVLPVAALAFADQELCKWRWLRKMHSSGKGSSSSKDKAAAAAGDWEDTGCSSMCYTPTQQDIGYMLRVECTPAAAAAAGADVEQQLGVSQPSAAPVLAAAAVAPAEPQQQQQTLNHSSSSAASSPVVYGEPLTAETGPVQAGPEQPAARLRQLNPAVPLPEPWRFRVMSYNILADQYAGTSYAQQVLFNYCPTRLLDNNYRRQLVLEEVLRYQPDICCLQEVDDKVFAEFLQPHLALAGWAGHFTNKQGRVREGSALFWRTDKWACAAVQDVKLRDVFKLPLAERHAQFTPMLQRSPDLAEALQKVTTIAQMVLLLPRHSLQTPAAAAGSSKAEPNSSSSSSSVAAGQPAPLLMLNTHLFFHPYAPHIRSLHTAAILEEAAAALADWQQQAQAAAAAAAVELNPSSSSSAVEPRVLGELAGLPPPTVLFCGDLNSDLNSGVPGVVEMLQTGRLAADHWDWQMGASFRWGKEEGEYAEESEQQQQQQQQQQEGQQQQQEQQQQQQQLPLADGHDFEPPSSSPRAAVGLHGMDVAVPFVLRSSDDLATPYTNYTSGYKALLDYVWYDPSQLHVTRQLPVPAEQLLASFIPSPNFPSDHLAVVYDLAFKPAVITHVITDPAAAAGVPGQQGVGIQQHDSATFTLLPASEDHVSDAVAALARGDVIALPTDTLYGLAAAADSAAAVQQLRAIKQRAPSAPFAVAVADVDDVQRYCVTEQLPAGLLRALLPGPVTVLLPLRPDAALAQGVLQPGSSSNGSDTAAAAAAAAGAVVGVRVVPNEFVRGVCRQLGGGIALTSANRSGGESSLCVHDFRELWQYCGAVFDSGRIPVAGNAGSTVLDLTSLAQQQQQQGEGAAAVGFRVVRAGVAAESAVELLTKAFGLQLLQ